MTLIENDSPKVQYTGPFVKGQLLPLTFPYIATEDVKMIIDDTPAIFNVDYEIITEPDDEHPVAYPNSAYIKNDLPNAEQITLYRVTPLDQQAPFPHMSKFRSERIEQALDKLTMQQQEQEEQLSRCIIAPITLETFNGQLPAPAANQALKWNAEGTELENYDIIGEQEAFENDINTRFEEQSIAFENRVSEFEEDTNAQLSEFRNEINENLEVVLDAAAKLENLDSSVQAAENAALQANVAANTAAEQAEIAINKAEETTELVEQFTENIDSKISINNENMQSVLAETEAVLQEAKDTLDDTLNKSQITNCITEIPQRIKLDIADDGTTITITLKAGSIIRKPDGGNNTEKTITQDIVRTTNSGTWGTADSDWLIWTTGGGVDVARMSDCSSGSSPVKTTSGALWYDTTNKIIKRYSGSAWEVAGEGIYYPIGIMSIRNGRCNLKEVFNGFGVIGGIYWTEKGIKSLASKGRNEDETLNNIELTTADFYIREVTFDKNLLNTFHLRADGLMQGRADYWNTGNVATTPVKLYGHLYDPYKNLHYYGNQNTNSWTIDDGTFTTNVCDAFVDNNGQITSFKTKLPFRAVDYNDVVKKSGDTMTGDLVIKHSTYPNIRLRHLTQVAGTTPSAQQECIYRFEDKNGNLLGYISNVYRPEGTRFTRINCRNADGSASQNFEVGYNADGKVYYNRPQIINSYVNGTSGYNIWSNGYCEQWGRSVHPSGGRSTVTFLKTFANANAMVTCSGLNNGFNNSDFGHVTAISATQASFASANGAEVTWFACGYLASNQY